VLQKWLRNLLCTRSKAETGTFREHVLLLEMGFMMDWSGSVRMPARSDDLNVCMFVKEFLLLFVNLNYYTFKNYLTYLAEQYK